MQGGIFYIGEYIFSPKMSEDKLKKDEFNIIDLESEKVFISKEPMKLCQVPFGVNIYINRSQIYKIELTNAEKKYALNYNNMTMESVENLRKENDLFLKSLMGESYEKKLSGIEYNFEWGKILSYYDNKSAETGIVILYL